MSTHNLCFRAKIRKTVYPCKPQFNYIKVGCKGVFITQICYHDGNHFEIDRSLTNMILLFVGISIVLYVQQHF